MERRGERVTEEGRRSRKGGRAGQERPPSGPTANWMSPAHSQRGSASLGLPTQPPIFSGNTLTDAPTLNDLPIL
jgi:hypothetical protein